MNDETGANLDCEIAPEDPLEAAPPASLPMPLDAYEDLRPPRPSRGWLWLLPTVILAAACIYLGVQNRAAAATVEALTTKTPALLLPLGAPNPLDAQLQAVRQSAQKSNFLTAARSAQALTLPSAPAAERFATPTTPEAPTAAAPEVTPQMATFFRQHPDLDQRLLQYSEAAAQARDAGKNVQPLRELRAKILTAAGAGNLAQVRALLNQFAQGLAAVGANPGAQAPPRLPLGAELQRALGQAQQEGRDLGPALAILQKAQAAVRAGQTKQAQAFSRQALEALKKAPRARPGAGGPGRPGAAPPPAERALGMTLSLMGAEDQDLARTYAALDEASRALRENNQAQIREILGQARRSLDGIQQRRRSFSQQLNQLAPAAPPSGKPQSKPGPALAPAEPAGPAERIAQLLDEARQLPADKYQAARLNLARATMGILLNSGPTAPPPPPAGQALTPAQREAAAEAEARVRGKLQLAQGPYDQLKRSGQSTATLDGLLHEARQALYDHRLAEAEAKANAVLRELQILPEDG